MATNTAKGGWLQLTPFFMFVGLFFISTIWFGSKLSPIFACAVAVIYSFFTFVERESLNKKIELFVKGSSRQTIITMVYIFIFASVFTYLLKRIGGIEAAVNIGLRFIPTTYILPGFFVIVSLFAVAIGTSMGAIAAFLPIGVGLAARLGISPSLMAGIVVGGAMLGDNLSIISDTTIAATQTTGARMVDKFKANVWYVLPAFLLTIGVLSYLNVSLIHQDYRLPVVVLQTVDFIRIIPYCVVFGLALLGLDVIAVLLTAIFLGIGIGVAQGYFSFFEGTSLILEGFSRNEGGIHEVLVLSLFIAGLAYIVEYNGGLTYLLEKFGHRIKSRAHAEASISILIFIINAAVAINTVAILVCGPVAKRIADVFGIPPQRTASLLDIFACICQGILPYAPQLLLAGSLAGVSSMSIIPYLHYQGFILLVMIVSMGFSFMRRSISA